jgi:hypothetical protein
MLEKTKSAPQVVAGQPTGIYPDETPIAQHQPQPLQFIPPRLIKRGKVAKITQECSFCFSDPFSL